MAKGEKFDWEPWEKYLFDGSMSAHKVSERIAAEGGSVSFGSVARERRRRGIVTGETAKAAETPAVEDAKGGSKVIPLASERAAVEKLSTAEPAEAPAEVDLAAQKSAANIEAEAAEVVKEIEPEEDKPVKVIIQEPEPKEDFELKPQTEEELTPKEKPNKEQKRSTLAGVEAVADPEQVAAAREAVGTLMDLEAVAVALGVTKRTALALVNAKEGNRLKAVKIGAVWKVTPENLRKFIEGE